MSSRKKQTSTKKKSKKQKASVKSETKDEILYTEVEFEEIIELWRKRSPGDCLVVWTEMRKKEELQSLEAKTPHQVKFMSEEAVKERYALIAEMREDVLEEERRNQEEIEKLKKMKTKVGWQRQYTVITRKVSSKALCHWVEKFEDYIYEVQPTDQNMNELTKALDEKGWFGPTRLMTYNFKDLPPGEDRHHGETFVSGSVLPLEGPFMLIKCTWCGDRAYLFGLRTYVSHENKEFDVMDLIPFYHPEEKKLLDEFSFAQFIAIGHHCSAESKHLCVYVRTWLKFFNRHQPSAETLEDVMEKGFREQWLHPEKVWMVDRSDWNVEYHDIAKNWITKAGDKTLSGPHFVFRCEACGDLSLVLVRGFRVEIALRDSPPVSDDDV